MKRLLVYGIDTRKISQEMHENVNSIPDYVFKEIAEGQENYWALHDFQSKYNMGEIDPYPHMVIRFI